MTIETEEIHDWIDEHINAYRRHLYNMYMEQPLGNSNIGIWQLFRTRIMYNPKAMSLEKAGTIATEELIADLASAAIFGKECKIGEHPIICRGIMDKFWLDKNKYYKHGYMQGYVSEHERFPNDPEEIDIVFSSNESRMTPLSTEVGLEIEFVARRRIKGD